MWFKGKLSSKKNLGLQIVAIIDILALQLCFLYGIIAFYIMRASYFVGCYAKAGYDAASKLTITEEDLKRVLQAFLSYVRGSSNSAQIALNIDGHLQTFFNEKELTHLADVASIFKTARLETLACLVIVITFSAILIYRILKEKSLAIILLKAWLIDAIFILIIVALLGLSYKSSNFTFITKLHRLLFDNNLWIMGSSDSLSAFFPSKIYGYFLGTIFAGIGGFNLILLTGILALQKLPEKLFLFFGKIAVLVKNLAFWRK